MFFSCVNAFSTYQNSQLFYTLWANYSLWKIFQDFVAAFAGASGAGFETFAREVLGPRGEKGRWRWSMLVGWVHQKLNGTESQRTPKKVSCDRANRYSGFFGVRSVGPVGDFLDWGGEGWKEVCWELKEEIPNARWAVNKIGTRAHVPSQFSRLVLDRKFGTVYQFISPTKAFLFFPFKKRMTKRPLSISKKDDKKKPLYASFHLKRDGEKKRWPSNWGVSPTMPVK